MISKIDLFLFLVLTGFYRVNYDDKNWLKIADYLNSEDYENIHVLNRAQIIDDAYHFAIKGEMKNTTFLKIIKYLKQETSFIPWYSMMNILQYMTPYLQFPGSQDFKVRKFLITLMRTGN